MLKGVVLLLIVAGCHADTHVAPTQQVLCGEMPGRIFECLGNVRLIQNDASKKCRGHSSQCDSMTCVFTESGWFENGKVNKKKVSDYFDQYARDHPSWSPAVNHLKAACLGDHELLAQGAYLNCPAFDIAHCLVTSFVKNASPSQWKTTPECQYPRTYAGACPVCPESCFVPQVPYGTCNACMTLPRSV